MNSKNLIIYYALSICLLFIFTFSACDLFTITDQGTWEKQNSGSKTDNNKTKSLTVLSVIPGDNATSQNVSINIVIRFNESLDTSIFGTFSFSSPSLNLTHGSNCIMTFSTSTNSNDTVTINPDNNFASSQTYSDISITGFANKAGIVMSAYNDSGYDFTTADSDFPSISSISPGDGAISQDVSVNIVIIFNKTLDTSTYGTVSFSSPALVLTNGSNCKMSFSTTNNSNDTITIDPDNNFSYSQTYNDITISGFKDTTGNTIDSFNNADYDFTTAEKGVPTVSAITPRDGASSQDVSVNIVIRFNESMDLSTFGTVSFSSPALALTNGSNCSMSFSTIIYTNDTVTIDPDSNLDSLKTYSDLTVSGFQDASGTAMSRYNDPSYDFTTADVEGPNILSISPEDNSTSQNVSVNFIVQFNESLDTSASGTISFSSPSLTLINGSNCTMAYSTTVNSYDTVTINPDSNLTYSQTYRDISISGFKDTAGNTMNNYSDSKYDFTTASDIAPSISSITPGDGAVSQDITVNIIIQFDESMKNSVFGTVTLASHSLTYTNGSNCSMSFSTSAYANDTVTINPDTDLFSSDTYGDIYISGFEDTTGNTMSRYSDSGYYFETVDTDPPSVITVTPGDMSTEVAVEEDIVIQFNESLNSSVFGTVSISSPSLILTNGSNCTMTFSTASYSNDMVTIDYDDNFVPSQMYMGISVSGFADTSDNTMTGFNDSVHDFTTEASGTAKLGVSTISADDSSYFNAVTTDLSGNIYAVGHQFSNGNYDYGNGNITGNYASGNNIIVKYDSSGAVQWAKSNISAPYECEYLAVATDSSGNVYAAGYQYGNSTYDYGSVSITSSNPGSNVLLVKYDPNGNVQWAKSTVLSTNNSQFNAVAVDSSGYIYAAGFQSNTTAVNYGNSVIINGAHDINSVLVKYDSNGNAQWARTILTANNVSKYYSVAVDSSGYAYAAGYQYGNLAFNYGSGELTGSSTMGNAVLIKYAPDGIIIWAKTTISGISDSEFKSVAVDASGYIYAAGSQRGSATYNYGSGNISSAHSDFNAVIVKYNAGGTAQWARTTSAAINISSFTSIAVDSSGNVYTAGYLTEDDNFDFGGVNVSGDFSGQYNALIVKYNSIGAAQWANSTVTASNESLFESIAVDSANGYVYTAGYQMSNNVVNYGSGDVSGADANKNAVLVKWLY